MKAYKDKELTFMGRRKGVAMAAYLTKYRSTQYRRLNTLHCFQNSAKLG